MVGALLFLTVLVGFGGWIVWKNSTIAPEKPKTTVQSEPALLPSAGKSRTLNYSLIVQKMRDGKKFQAPFESSGQEIFENGYQFQMNFTPPDEGFLYVFAEGLDDGGDKIYNLIFPFTVEQNDGKADVSANRQYKTGWNQFGGTAGTENFWIIWSKQQPEAVEESRADSFKSEIGELTDNDLIIKLKNYLEKERNDKAQMTKDSEKKLTKVDFKGDSLVYLIQLEHR